MDEGEVDEQLPGHQEDEVGLEGDATGESTGDEGWRDDREHHLVDDEQQDWYVGVGLDITNCDALQEGKIQIPDDSPLTAAEA